MQLNEIHSLIAQTCEFPADSDGISKALGEQEIDSPTGKSRTINEILANQQGVMYNSPDGVYTAIVGNLDEAFIGRKYYDDRAATLADSEHVRELHSF